MKKFYLHFLDGSRCHRGSIIAIDNSAKPPKVEHRTGGSPLIDVNGNHEIFDNGWTLGAVETEQAATNLALTLARHYGCDVMAEGKVVGLPYMGNPGEWVSNSEAATALGKIRSEKKTLANRAKANLPPKEGKKPRGWQKGVSRKKPKSDDAN